MWCTSQSAFPPELAVLPAEAGHEAVRPAVERVGQMTQDCCPGHRIPAPGTRLEAVRRGVDRRLCLVRTTVWTDQAWLPSLAEHFGFLESVPVTAAVRPDALSAHSGGGRPPQQTVEVSVGQGRRCSRVAAHRRRPPFGGRSCGEAGYRFTWSSSPKPMRCTNASLVDCTTALAFSTPARVSQVTLSPEPASDPPLEDPSAPRRGFLGCHAGEPQVDDLPQRRPYQGRPMPGWASRAGAS